MIPGYNHNIKYNDDIYHIQTEDSGIQNPHIITHLFVGGNIIESRKTSYADIVNNVHLSELLVDLMQDQHKQMLKDLICGKLDNRISSRSINAATLDGPAPLNVDAGAQQRVSLFGGMSGATPSESTPATTETPTAPSLPKVVTNAPPPEQPVSNQPPPVAPSPVAPLPASQDSFLGDAIASSFFGDAPPADKVIDAETLQKAFETKNESAVDSIFGEDLISEKSLDEVILSYLAEDMQK